MPYNLAITSIGRKEQIQNNCRKTHRHCDRCLSRFFIGKVRSGKQPAASLRMMIMAQLLHITQRQKQPLFYNQIKKNNLHGNQTKKITYICLLVDTLY